MAGKQVKIQVGLDFQADNMSIDKIRDQMNLAFKAMKINLDPASHKKAEAQLKELGRLAERSFDKSTNTMNFKALEQYLASSNITGSLDNLDKNLIEMGVNGTKSINAIKVANNYLEKSLVGSNNILTKMGTTLMNTIRWNISSSAVNAVVGEFQRAYNFSKDLDRSLTNIRIVSGLSSDNMARFAVEANKSAQSLKVSTIDYTEASLVFYQQGLKALEVKKMAEASIIGANITGESTKEMSTLLTSVVNGYKIAAQDVFTVTDKLAAVGATTASDFYELATAMSKVASMANAAGVPIDELNAQIATIVSVTKESPESIGTSLKTIYGRMLAFKTDSKALMKDEDGEVFGAPNVEEALQAYSKVTGAQISLFKVGKDGKKELRDLSEVLEEVGDSWGNTEDKVAKFGLATALAGSRQQNRLVALFDSWDMYKDAVETSLNAEGTSMRQNEIYMDSYQGKLEGLQAAKEEMYISFIDSEGLKSFIEGLTSAVQLMSKLSEHTGNLGGVLGVLGAMMAKPAMNMLGKLPNITSGAGTSAAPEVNVDTGVNERLVAEIANREKLMVINKAYGAEEANRIRMALKGATEEHLAHKRKSDNLSQEADMIEQIGIVMKMKDEDSKKDRMDEIIEENAGLESTKFNVQQVEQAYNDVANAQQSLNALLLEAPTESTKAELYKAVEEAEVELAIAEAKVEEIKASVEALRDGSYTSAIDESLAGDIVENLQGELDETAEAAERVNRQTQAIQAGMLLVLPTLSMAKDSTNSWGQVMSTIPKMMLPMLPAIITGLGEVAGATAGVTGVAAKLGAVMTTSLGPIIWAAVAAAALGTAMHFAAKAANEYKDAVAEVETTSGVLEKETQEYANINNEITEIIKKLKELEDLEKAGGDHSEEIAALTARKELLEEEKIIQQFNLQLAREKAEAAALEAAQAKITSEYMNTSGRGSGYSKGGDRVTVVQELEAVNASYEDNINKVKDLTGKLAKLSGQDKESVATRKQLNAALASATKARDKDKEAMTKHSASIIENNKHMGTSTEEQRKAKAEAQAVVKVTTELMESTKDETFAVQGSTDAYDEHAIAVEAAKQAKAALAEKIDDLNKQFDGATSNIQTFNGFLKEMTTKEGLSAKSKQELITKYDQFLPYLNDEIALRREIEQAMLDEEQAQYDTYIAKLSMSEDYYTQLEANHGGLINEFARLHEIDLSNAVTLADAKEEVETQLINRLAELWAGYYEATATGLERTQGYERQLEVLGRKAGMGKDFFTDKDGNSAEWDRIQEQLAQFKAMDEAVREGAAAAEKAKDDWAALMDKTAFKGVSEELKKINSELSEAGKGSKGSSSTKFLGTIEAEIRAIKIKNDNLIKTRDLLEDQLKLAKDIEGIEGLNKQYEITGQIIEHNKKMLESFKEEQRLVNEKAEQIRNQNKKYDTTTWFDANGEATTSFIQQQNDLIKAINNAKDDSTKKRLESQLNEMNLVFDQIQKLKKAWMESAGEIDKGNEYIKELEKSLGAILDQSRELSRQNWIKEQNELYDEQQKRLSALNDIQEKLVAIIRKRGEEEKRILDDNHKAEMESLEERHKDRKEKYADELDTFKKMIQDKIDALDSQYEEEDYLEQLNKEREEANRLQGEIDVLSLDDSLTARNKTVELRKQLADQNDKIAKMQQKKERDTLKKSLQDQLKNHEETAKNKDEIADTFYKNEKKRLEEDYKINKKALEDQYSDEKVYAEAREKILQAQADKTGKMFKDMLASFNTFEDKFGKGMGILGEIIQKDLIDQLSLAEKAIKGMEYKSSNQLPKYESDHQPNESDYNSSKTSSGEVDGGKLSSMSKMDYNKYRSNKYAWETYDKMSPQTDDIKRKKQIYADSNKKLREHYGISSDAYTYDDLKDIPWEKLKDNGFINGGKITETGTLIAPFHGRKDTPEWIFNDTQLKNIMRDVTMSAVKIAMPQIPNVTARQGITLQIDNFIKADNITKESIPELKKVQANAMEGLKNLLNKNGVRPSLI